MCISPCGSWRTQHWAHKKQYQRKVQNGNGAQSPQGRASPSAGVQTSASILLPVPMPTSEPKPH
jgi:hypothetical protein